MFTEEAKVSAEQRRRAALVNIRQCSRTQVFNSSESLARQYALRDRASALGWPLSRIHTIHSHIDPSAPQGQRHAGFQQLLCEVLLGRAGIVLAMERSCFTRQPAQWQQLLEACARKGTLISLDSGLYDPADLNDRYRLNDPLRPVPRRVLLHLLQRLSRAMHVD
jgi:hypothetical protein